MRWNRKGEVVSGGYSNVCLECGETFWSVRRSKFCSPAHRSRDYKRRAGLTKPPCTVQCLECGLEFSTTREATMCSDECRETRWKRENPSRNSWWITKKQRYAIYERDQWQCYLCGDSISPYARHDLRDNGAVLDHVVPYSQGGSHGPDNLQTAHYVCNWERRDNPLTAEQQARRERILARAEI